jgi:cytidylate kinase
VVRDNKNYIIAIDGPAGSGKSTTAKEVAKRLGFLHLDSGAMYRAATLLVLDKGLESASTDSLVRVIGQAEIDLDYRDDVLRVFLNATDVTQKIRGPEVTAAIAPIAANQKIRHILVAKQRGIAQNTSVVAEGRDMGTVVFPDADLKIFMIASIAERAERRYNELTAKGIKVDFDGLINEISERDWSDSNRLFSPLKRAADAVELDTTGKTIEEQVQFVILKAMERGVPIPA